MVKAKAENIENTGLLDITNEVIADKLEIILITFNRASRLKNTLEQLFAENSPVKDFSITVIDNNSTDDTPNVIQEYCSKHHNLKCIKNRYNIGGNANIAKAFYEASKEYVWVLADNDDYSWECWEQVKREIINQTDAIVVATYECPKVDIAQLFLQMTFLPGVIYKTSNIDDTVMLNMEFNISNVFSHLALAAKLINEHKNIVIVDKPLVLIGSNNDEEGKYVYYRGYEGFIHPLLDGMGWICGYANSLHLIKDSKIRNYIISHNSFGTELNSAKVFFYKDKAAGNHLYNYLCVFAVLSGWDKLKFLINFILYLTLYRIIFIKRQIFFDFDKNQKIIRYDIRLFTFIKTKLFKITREIKGE